MVVADREKGKLLHKKITDNLISAILGLIDNIASVKN
jgi:hypothetical protein